MSRTPFQPRNRCEGLEGERLTALVQKLRDVPAERDSITDDRELVALLAASRASSHQQEERDVWDLLEQLPEPSAQDPRSSDPLRTDPQEDDATADGEMVPGRGCHAGEQMLPVRDPLLSRRVQANVELERFVRDQIRTPGRLRLLRLYVITGMERLTTDELHEELVVDRLELANDLEHLQRAGLILRDRDHVMLNPRSRGVSQLATVLSRWQSSRHRTEIWNWLTNETTL